MQQTTPPVLTGRRRGEWPHSWPSLQHRSREGRSKLQYARGPARCAPTLLPWARQLFEYLSATCIRTTWVNRVYRLEQKYVTITEPVQAETARRYTKEMRERVREKEEEMW